MGSVGGQAEGAHPSATDPPFLQTSSARGAPWREPCSSSRLRNARSPWATLTAGISSPWGSAEPTRQSPAPAPLKGTPSKCGAHRQQGWAPCLVQWLFWLSGRDRVVLMGWFILCRFRFTLELFLTGEKVQQLGTDGPETLQAWASAIGKVSQPHVSPDCACVPTVTPHSSPYSSSALGSTVLPCRGSHPRW